mmetsp:Transcript_13043/g.27468  ORF Transcript_13043/g.27468 Transcript_13043/m.27468 type:complete len:232 (-) Transcript_13043:106-801(-)
MFRNSMDSKQLPFLCPASAMPWSIGRNILSYSHSHSHSSSSLFLLVVVVRVLAFSSSTTNVNFDMMSDRRDEMALWLLLAHRKAFPNTRAPSRSRRHRSIVSCSILDSPVLEVLLVVASVPERNKKSQRRLLLLVVREAMIEEGWLPFPVSISISSSSLVVKTLLRVSAAKTVAESSNNFSLNSRRAAPFNCWFLNSIAIVVVQYSYCIYILLSMNIVERYRAVSYNFVVD